jgi:hypothetical protein
MEAKDIEAALKAVRIPSGQEWDVSIIGDQKNTKWAMTISGPQNYSFRHTLYGEDGGHKPAYIAALLKAELTQAREIHLVLAELIREDIPFDVTRANNGIMEIDGVNIDVADAISMRITGRLSRVTIQEYARKRGAR